MLPVSQIGSSSSKTTTTTFFDDPAAFVYYTTLPTTWGTPTSSTRRHCLHHDQCCHLLCSTDPFHNRPAISVFSRAHFQLPLKAAKPLIIPDQTTDVQVDPVVTQSAPKLIHVSEPFKMDSGRPCLLHGISNLYAFLLLQNCQQRRLSVLIKIPTRDRIVPVLSHIRSFYLLPVPITKASPVPWLPNMWLSCALL